MSPRVLPRAVIALASGAAIVFAGAAVTELNYVSAHPRAYGPAQVIAWAAAGSAMLSVAVGLLAGLVGQARSGDVGDTGGQTRRAGRATKPILVTCFAFIVAVLGWNAGELHRRSCISSGKSGCSVLPWVAGNAPVSPASLSSPEDRERTEVREAIRRGLRDEAVTRAELEAKR